MVTPPQSLYYSLLYDHPKAHQSKINEAYEHGYGAVENNNIANKLLEMGILTHIEFNKDFDTREKDFF